jgi:predicted nucleic acid-binding protein
MWLQFIHPSGKVVKVRASQTVIYTNDGLIAAIAYDNAGMLVVTDVQQQDFNRVIKQLGIKKLDTSNANSKPTKV